MKTRRRIFWIAAVWALALACNPKKEEPVPEPVPEIKVPAESQAVFSQGISLDAEASAQIPPVKFTATASWSAKVDDTKASDWLSVEPTSGGAGSVTLTVTAKPNEGKADREAEVTLTCGKDVHKFTVSQAGVPDIDVESVTLDITEITLVEGTEADLKATVLPENATDPSVTWTTSDESVATVADGKVTAMAPGTATITAQAGEKTATCAVTVEKKFIPVSSVELDKHTLTLVEGDEAGLKAAVLPEDATDPAVTWTTSEVSVATVADGQVKALAPGRAVIKAQAGEQVDSCVVTVEKRFIPVTSVALNEHALTLVEGDETTLTATVKPDEATDPTVSWTTSDASVATVDGGKVKTLKPGKVTITAQAGEKTDACVITVDKRFIPVTSVSLNEHTLTLVEGDETTLSATVKPDDATEPSVSWSTSDASVATVDGGKVKTLKPGKVTITAKAGEKSDSCEITVEKRFIPVTSVTLNEHALTLVEGDETTLTATVKPDDVTEPAVTWSTSDASIATVDGGKVKTLKPGKVTIKAQAGDKSDSCEITVEKRIIAVTSLTLNEHSLTLTEGDEVTLSATVKPDDATDKTVTWTTSDASVATVDGGKVKTLKPGTVTISAKAEDQSDDCVITVEKRIIPVVSVTLNEHSLTLTEGDETTLKATVKPDDATDKTVTWTTSDASVATVSEGHVKTLTPGVVTIKAQAGDQSDACVITVEKKYVPVTSLSLNQTELTLLADNEATLTAIIKPDDATDRTVTWTSSNPSVAKVYAGWVTALQVGEATITASIGEFSATCKVTVEYQFSISPLQVTVSGDGQEFTVKVKCPEAYQVESMPEWITQVSVSGKIHRFKAVRNPARTERVGTIVFLDGKETRLSCQVTQGGYVTEIADGGNEQVGEGEEIDW